MLSRESVVRGLLLVRSSIARKSALLARGANPDARNSLGTSPLCEAVAIGDERLVGLLLKAGADPNQGNNDEQTPLMIAARIGSLPLAQMLVKAGAHVN